MTFNLLLSQCQVTPTQSLYQLIRETQGKNCIAQAPSGNIRHYICVLKQVHKKKHINHEIIITYQ